LELSNPQLMHDKVNEITARKKCRSPPSCIEAKDGTIIMEKLQNLGTMERIHTVCELFEDERGAKPMSHKQSGLPILEDEVVCALKGMAKGKAPGPDGLSFEMLDAFGEFGIDTITRLANKFYNEGKFTTEMTKSVFITMPEKAGATKCEHYRTISLMSRLTKLIIHVLQKRIGGRTADEVAEEQYGFMPNKGTRKAIFLLRMLTERSIQTQKDLYMFS